MDNEVAAATDSGDVDDPDIAVGLVDAKDNIYYIEKIVNYKVKGNKELYFVKWEGWPSKWNNWECFANVESCPLLIEDYFEQNPAKRKIHEKFLAKTKKPKKLKGLVDNPEASVELRVDLPDKAVFHNIDHLLYKKANQYYPILGEDEVRTRRVEKIYTHYSHAAYLVHLCGDPVRRLVWIKQKDAVDYCRVKLSIYLERSRLKFGRC